MNDNTLGPYLLGPNDTEENGIYCGDARELALDIPDNSIDLVFTDPVYDDMSQYEYLATTSYRVLRQHSSMVAFIAIGKYPDTLQALRHPGMSWRWRLTTRTAGSKEFHGRLCVMTQEAVWYEKGRAKLHHALFEFNYSKHNSFYNVNGANWGKGFDVVSIQINALSKPDDIVLDPFCGSGTTPAVCKSLGRRYLAFEIDKDTCNLARDRVRNTQPPLFIPEPQQTRMEL